MGNHIEDKVIRKPIGTNVETIKVEKTNEKKYDENYEGYFVVSSSAVNVRSTPDIKSKNNIVKVLLNGEKPYCDGYFEIVNGEKWFHVSLDGIDGYIIEKHIDKL